MFNKLFDQLHKGYVKIEEEDKAFLLLASFPDSYNNLVITFLFGEDTVSLKDITTSLLFNEIRRRLNLEEGLDFRLVCRVENYKRRSLMRGFGNRKSISKFRGKASAMLSLQRIWAHK